VVDLFTPFLRLQCGSFSPVLRIRIDINADPDKDPDLAFLVNADTDQKLQFTYIPSETSIEDVQATGEVFIPQKKTSRSRISKLEYSSFFVLWVILALLDLDPAYPDPADQNECRSVRIRIRNTGFSHHVLQVKPSGQPSAVLVTLVPQPTPCCRSTSSLPPPVPAAA
jgi:hypothetical protein